MCFDLSAIPRKLKAMPPPSAAGLSYPQLLSVYRAMAAQDARIVFDSTRPLADEFWNLIDGQRTLQEIAQRCCLQFGFRLEPALFVPFAKQLMKLNLIAVESATDKRG